MNLSRSDINQDILKIDQQWFWWPLLPLYPYGHRRSLFRELVPNQLWSLEQLQGLYYVAVPVRLTVVKVPKGLMLVNPLPPTKELMGILTSLEKEHGPVLTIVLPTASGLEHKISMPSLARAFPNADLWVCPGQWSFPFQLPLTWLGIPGRRTRTLINDGFPHQEVCSWLSLGPIDIGLGRFQEISCFHKPSGAVLVTDSLVGIQSSPPKVFDFDPTPLLFHSRDKGDQPLKDSPELRRKGWARLVLFASFLRPGDLLIPPIVEVLKNSFKPGLRNPRAHFGVFPFDWQDGWEISAKQLIGEKKPLLQVAPVLERLIFPRAKEAFFKWLDQLATLNGVRLLIPAHYEAPLEFNPRQVRSLREKLSCKDWAPSKGNWGFLGAVDKALFKSGIVPKDPLESFKD